MKFKSLYILFFLFLIVSCQSDQKSKDNKQEALKKYTELDALTSVSEVYDTYKNSEDYLIKGLFYPANLLSQDLNLWGNEGAYFKTFDIPADYSPLDKFWSLSYEGISNANKALALLDQLMQQKIIAHKLGNRLKAECYFNRGLLYFYLASNFGNVPLILNTTDTLKEQSPEKQVFEQIVKDFNLAKDFLPFSYPEKTDLGRATKGAVLAYLGETYMWLRQYEEALNTFKELEGHYTLMPKFIDINSFKHQNNEESIFEIQFNGNDNLGWGRDNYSTFIQSFALPTEVGGSGLVFVNPKLYKSFSKTDSRKRASIIAPGETHPNPNTHISSYNRVQEKFKGINTLGTKNKPWKGEDNSRSGYYNLKTWRTPDPNASASPVFSKANVILMRYGQVLLDIAECELRLNNPIQALKNINKIRKRAGLKAVNSKNLEDKLFNEYRHELVGDYSLWYILRRSGNYQKYLKENFDISLKPGHELLPIPTVQLKLNGKLKQNIGY